VAGEPVEFFSAEWASRVREAIHNGPGPAALEAKLPTYWDWVAGVREGYDGSWLLAAESGTGSRAVLVEWSGGACVDVRLVDDPAAARDEATYAVTATETDWRLLLGGYDPARLVMYRRFRLDQGSVQLFFRLIYFFVECLACVAAVPTAFPEPGAAA
jgi:hypothetical protein